MSKINDNVFSRGYFYSWANVSVNINGIVINNIVNIDYRETHNQEKIMGRGNVVVGYGAGNYETEGSLTLHKDAVLAFQQAAKEQNIPFNNIMGLSPFTITVKYGGQQGQVPITEILHNAVFLSNGVSMSQGDTSVEVELPIHFTHVTSGSL